MIVYHIDRDNCLKEGQMINLIQSHNNLLLKKRCFQKGFQNMEYIILVMNSKILGEIDQNISSQLLISFNKALMRFKVFLSWVCQYR